MAGKVGGLAAPNTAALDPASDQKMQGIEKRLGQMETFLNESMVFSVYRAKEMRNRLNVIEGLLQGQANVSAAASSMPQSHADEWDAPPIFGRNGHTNGTGAPAITNFSA